jgi:2-polyprenyl-3-methyl-5-hydroxy-6-metoxy-1,4-benzoquinol methylase
MAYTKIDDFIARMRFRAAYPHVRAGTRVCDLGCGLEAAFLDYAADKVASGVGVDDQVESGVRGRWQRVHADITKALPLGSEQFDHVVMLAVLEHLVEPELVLR